MRYVLPLRAQNLRHWKQNLKTVNFQVLTSGNMKMVSVACRVLYNSTRRSTHQHSWPTQQRNREAREPAGLCVIGADELHRQIVTTLSTQPSLVLRQPERISLQM